MFFIIIFNKIIFMFKVSVIENKRKIEFERKQRLNVMHLRNKFLGEWAANILGFDENKKKIYINKIIKPSSKEEDKKAIIKKIEKDFVKNNIKIYYKEIEFKIKDFQIKANIVVENKFKLNSWK